MVYSTLTVNGILLFVIHTITTFCVPILPETKGKVFDEVVYITYYNNIELISFHVLSIPVPATVLMSLIRIDDFLVLSQDTLFHN